MKSIFKLLGVVIGVAAGGYLIGKAVKSSKKKEATEHTAEGKEEKQKKEKSEIHPKVRIQVAIAQAAGKMADLIINHKKELDAAVKLLTLGAAILSFAHTARKLISDYKLEARLDDIQKDLQTLKNRDSREAWTKGWRESTKDVLSKMRYAAENNLTFGMVDNKDGNFFFKVKMVDC